MLSGFYALRGVQTWLRHNPVRPLRNWRKAHSRILRLESDPFSGIGKPDPLTHALAGYWSRRIDASNRMVYKVSGDSLMIAQLRYHYSPTFCRFLFPYFSRLPSRISSTSFLPWVFCGKCPASPNASKRAFICPAHFLPQASVKVVSVHRQIK
mgnify:CR=1 FL=1